MPKIICMSNVDDHLDGTVLDASVFSAEQLKRLTSLGAVRELAEGELADFLEEETEQEQEEQEETVPVVRAKTIKSMNLTELAAFCVEHGLAQPEGTRAQQIVAIEAALSARNADSNGLPPDVTETGNGGSQLPDDIS